MADERLSNVVGAPFQEYVLTQLGIRALHNSTTNRSNEEILFLANKTAWAKLTSSVRIQPTSGSVTTFYKNLGLQTGYSKPDELARNWILSAGTSQGEGAGITLRSGLGPEGSYGLGGIEEMGYRPMPGLTSVLVDSQGTLGSLRMATISFKVWNMTQLNVMEALYFRLGYSMLLEWGHTQYYSNKGLNGSGTFTTSAYGIDPFETMRKEIVQQKLAKRSKEVSGNYEGMLGIVSNFEWSFNQDGGYDCTVKLVGLGAILDSLRINLSYKMPQGLFQTYSAQQKTIEEDRQKKEEELKKEQAARTRQEQGLPPLPALPQNASEIYTSIYKNDEGTSNPAIDQATFLQQQAYSAAYVLDGKTLNSQPDYYYKANKGGAEPNTTFVNELNTSRTGLFLNAIQGYRSWQVVFADAPSPVGLGAAALNSSITQIRAFAGATGVFSESALSDSEATSRFVKYVDLAIRDLGNIFRGEFKIDLDEKLYQIKSIGIVTPDQPLEILIPYKALVINPLDGKSIEKNFNIKLTYNPEPVSDPINQQVEAGRLTRREFRDALQKWLNDGAKINVQAVSQIIDNELEYLKVQGSLAGIVVAGKQAPLVNIEFDNTGLIQTVYPPVPIAEPQPALTEAGNAGDTEGAENGTESQQIDEADRFASSLHAMLAIVQSAVVVELIKSENAVVGVDLTGLTKELYQDTVFDGLLTLGATNPNSFDLQQYALRGFNSNLMVNPEQIATTPVVSFKNLCLAYGIKYKDQDSVKYPVYIKFGYLMAFLNNMCLVYDSTTDADKHPYVYLDFNPDTNFCLTNPQHLSVDPYTCLIPFQGTQKDYLSIFPEEIRKALQDPFGPDKNYISALIESFKTPNNSYQGKTMEILLNVDFIVRTLNQYTTNDKEHAINLKGFLDAIVTAINKATGNFNLFRVAYRDDSNTVIIKDDQFVPPYPGESYMLDRSLYLSRGTYNAPKYGQLPVFGLQSLAREFQFKTNLASNVSKVVAISAQADRGAANSTDYSSFSYLNVDYVDAYKPRISNSTNTTSATSNVVGTGSFSNDLNQAQQFNTHILSIYYGGDNTVSAKRINSSVNYYINSMAGIKAADGITVAAPFIPANLEITIDGISGIVMGNAFTIPEDRLPVSLRGSDNQTKVGFVVVGLTHTIDKNQWLTKIRGQMIRLRDRMPGVQPTVVSTVTPPAPPQPTPPVTADIGDFDLSQDWVSIATSYIASKEGFISKPRFDVNRLRGGYGSDIIVTANNEVQNVTASTVFTKEDAIRTLKYNVVKRFAPGVVNQIGQDNWNRLNDRQKASLVSYAYNAGAGALSTWKIAKAIKTNATTEQVAALIKRGPVTAKGVVLKGLVERREEESLLYLS